MIRGIGELDQVEIAELPAPRSGRNLGAREVRVAVHAAALNHLDLFVVRGLPVDYTFPHVLGSDGAGVVDGVGAEVTAVRPGEPVLINPGVSCYACEFCRAGEHALCVSYQVLGERRPGTMAEYVVVPEANVARMPRLDPPLTWPEAAAFSLATLTAWRMVATRAKVRPGEWVLVWGIGGGVALMAMRIAKLRGAWVIVTTTGLHTSFTQTALSPPDEPLTKATPCCVSTLTFVIRMSAKAAVPRMRSSIPPPLASRRPATGGFGSVSLSTSKR